MNPFINKKFNIKFKITIVSDVNKANNIFREHKIMLLLFMYFNTYLLNIQLTIFNNYLLKINNGICFPFEKRNYIYKKSK